MLGMPQIVQTAAMPAATLDFEIGVPVTAPVSAVGRVRAGQLPAATAARTVYRTGPESGPDPANWCTELDRPLARWGRVPGYAAESRGGADGR